MYYFYLLQSTAKPKEIYTGSTNDLKYRINEHNQGKVFSTKRYFPWKLIYYEAYLSEKDARLREQKFKKHGKGNQELKKRLKNSLQGFTPHLFFQKKAKGLPLTFFKKKGEGFTLIEVLISLVIMAVLFSTLLLGKSNEEKKLGLQRSAYQLAQDLRETQEKAMGAEKAICDTHSFGIAFDKTWKNYYIIFADCDADQIRKVDGSEDIKKIYLEKEVEISNLSPTDSFSVVFKAPDPIVYINAIPWNMEAVITLSFNSSIKKVKINSAGRIETE
ncbi:GIY-YIG nuclease family protein [Patescibacteria group bacterium]|nr:GIY-YIG nuclease family protein [Patescibacteria group bacterium]